MVNINIMKWNAINIAQINKNKSSNRIGNALTIAKGHIQEFLECGLSDVDNPSNMSTYSNDGYFFRHKSLSKVLLVEMRRIELLSESPSAPGATIIVGNLEFPQSGSCRQDLLLGSFIKSLSSAKLRMKSSLRYCYTPYPKSRNSGRDGGLLIRLQTRKRLRYCLRLYLGLVITQSNLRMAPKASTTPVETLTSPKMPPAAQTTG